MAEAPEDGQLVREALDGSQDAITELVRRFERPVYSLIFRMVRDSGLAEDLAQEAFVNAFRNLHRFDPERRFASWLFKIAHNRTLDHLRRKRLNTVRLEGVDGESGVVDRIADDHARSPDRQHQSQEIQRAFESALDGLRPDYREVIVLRFQEGLAYREIAEILDLPLATVKTHIHRARKTLAIRLKEAGFGPETR